MQDESKNHENRSNSTKIAPTGVAQASGLLNVDAVKTGVTVENSASLPMDLVYVSRLSLNKLKNSTGCSNAPQNVGTLDHNTSAIPIKPTPGRRQPQFLLFLDKRYFISPVDLSGIFIVRRLTHPTTSFSSSPTTTTVVGKGMFIRV